MLSKYQTKRDKFYLIWIFLRYLEPIFSIRLINLENRKSLDFTTVDRRHTEYLLHLLISFLLSKENIYKFSPYKSSCLRSCKKHAQYSDTVCQSTKQPLEIIKRLNEFSFHLHLGWRNQLSQWTRSNEYTIWIVRMLFGIAQQNHRNL